MLGERMVNGRNALIEEWPARIVPLSLGRAPWDMRNRWPGPIADAERKDDQERRYHRLVCAHRMTLEGAQRIFIERRR